MEPDSQNECLRKFVLECATQATRPLRVLELADAIPVTRILGSELNLDPLALKGLIQEVCSPPLEISALETVLITGDNSDVDPGLSHDRLATLCLTYLSSSRPENAPFSKYAREHWLTHVQRAAECGSNMTDLYAMLDHLLVGDKAIKPPKLRGRLPNYYEDRDWGEVPALVQAVAYGLTEYARTIFERSGAAPPREFLSYWSRHGNEDMVDLLLEQGADLNEPDRDGFRALHQASRWNRPDVARLLLRAGADPCQLSVSVPPPIHDSAEPGQEFTPEFCSLELACFNGHTQVLEVLLEYIDTPETVHSALTWAVEGEWGRDPGHGSADTVRAVLHHPLVDINARVHHYTPLYIACRARNLEVIQLLLDFGADVNFLHDPIHPHVGRPVPGKGDTALHALAQGSWETRLTYETLSTEDEERLMQCVNLLVKAGAHVNQENPENDSPLHLSNDFATVKCLIDAGADINRQGSHGETLLHKLVKPLLSERLKPSTALPSILSQVLDLASDKIDVNIQTNLRLETPLSMVIKAGEIELADRILEMGPDMGLVDRDGAGRLHWTVKQVQLGSRVISLLAKLLSLGADPNARDNNLQTPLHYLFEERPGSPLSDYLEIYVDLAGLLLDAGAGPEKRDEQGRTSLLKAVESGILDFVQGRKLYFKMIEHGARPNTVDAAGRSLLRVSLEQRQKEAIEFLLDHGAGQYVVSGDGNTTEQAAAFLRTSQWPVDEPSNSVIHQLNDIHSDELTVDSESDGSSCTLEGLQ